jgi:hypothetical protein
LQLIPGRNAPSIDDRNTPHNAERQDDAKRASQTIGLGEGEQILELSQEREGNRKENDLSQPKMRASAVEAVGRQQELEQERGPSGEAQVEINSILQENIHGENHNNETAANTEDRTVLFATETMPMESEEVSKSAAAPAIARFLPTSSLSPSARSVPRLEEPLSSRARADSGGVASSHSLLDASEPSSLNPERTFTTQDGSPSRRQQSSLRGRDSSPQHTHTRVSTTLTQTENTATPVRIRARVSTESLSTYLSTAMHGHLRTPSEASVSSDWEGTIQDMECDCANGGGPIIFQAKLDTFARRDAIAENIVKRLGMSWKPDPEHTTFQVLGERAHDITPLGYVTINPRVIGRRGRLLLKCYVIKDADVGRAFDCLLGCLTSRIHFLALKEDASYRENLTEDPREE